MRSPETITSSMLDVILTASQMEASDSGTTHDSYTTDHPLGENEMRFAALCEVARRSNISIAEAAEKVNIITETPPATPEKTKEAYDLLIKTGKPTFILTNYRMATGNHWAIVALTKDRRNDIAVTHINSGIKAKEVESKGGQPKTIDMSGNSHLRTREIEDFVSGTTANIRRLHKSGTVVEHDFSVNRQHAECCGLACALSVGEVVALLDQEAPITDLPKSQRVLADANERETVYSAMARRTYCVLESLSTEANKNKPILTLEASELHRRNLITEPQSRTAKSATSIDALLVQREAQRVRQLTEFRKDLGNFADASIKNYNDKITLKTYLDKKYIRNGTIDLEGYRQEKEVITYIISRNLGFSMKDIIELSSGTLESVRKQNISDQEENRKAIYEELNKRIATKPIFAGISFVGDSKDKMPIEESAGELAILEELMGVKTPSSSKVAEKSSSIPAKPAPTRKPPAKPEKIEKKGDEPGHEQALDALYKRMDALKMNEIEKNKLLSDCISQDFNINIEKASDKIKQLEKDHEHARRLNVPPVKTVPAPKPPARAGKIEKKGDEPGHEQALDALYKRMDALKMPKEEQYRLLFGGEYNLEKATKNIEQLEKDHKLAQRLNVPPVKTVPAPKPRSILDRLTRRKQSDSSIER